MEYSKLGKSDLNVPPIGIGTAAWGFPFMGYGKTYTRKDLFQAYQTLLDNGYNFFDTAESYAHGESEKLLGEFQKEDGRGIIVATKCRAQRDPQQIFVSLKNSLARLQKEKIDLYQLHYPPPKDSINDCMDVMVETVKRGLVQAIGVCNFNADRMKKAIDRLAHHGIPLSSNQVYYNLLERRVESNGVLELCKELDIALIPFSPMAQGLLTGKHRKSGQKVRTSQKLYLWLQHLDLFKEDPHPKNIIRKILSSPFNSKILKLEPLFEAIDSIAKKHGATFPHVVINWLRTSDNHVIPIPGIKNVRQANDIMNAMKFNLTQEEHQILNDLQESIMYH
jgi:aryl-alcohol dehydrogenase-like predicted oxidoreductase